MLEFDLVKPARKPRRFIPDDLVIKKWAALQPYFIELADRELGDLEELRQWLADRTEIEVAVDEDFRWRYIHMTQDTGNKEYQEAYQQFLDELHDPLENALNALDKKLMALPFVDELPEDYQIYLKLVRNRLNIFCDANISLMAEEKMITKRYDAIVGAMTITHNGEELTMNQAANFLKETDRDTRETVFRAMQERRLQDADALDDIFDELVTLRHRIAQNAGFDNYRDYKFAELGRFDYTPADCASFHAAIEKEMIPVCRDIAQRRQALMKLESLRPWDLQCDALHREPLRPFKDGEELCARVKECFTQLNPYFGHCLSVMKEMEHLDLESRKNKAMGGYNSTLPEIGVPFIFMNAAGSSRDVEVMIHEGGHAVHSFLMRSLQFAPNREIPSEVAELASMSMELLTTSLWHVFYDNEADLNRARQEHIEGIFQVFPWVAIVDAFQHWIYENPGHSRAERETRWMELLDRFSDGVTDWSGLEPYMKQSWHRQLHIFEVPFYYIEYAIAQLGAIAVWRNYLQHPEETLERYAKALSLGYSKSISAIYREAGISFDFSPEYVGEQVAYLKAELGKLNGLD